MEKFLWFPGEGIKNKPEPEILVFPLDPRTLL